MIQQATRNDKRTKMKSNANVINAIGVLSALPEKQCSELSIKDSVTAMRSQICDLLGRNYSLVEIVEALNDQAGFDIKLTTFRSYFSALEKEIISEIRHAYKLYGNKAMFSRKLWALPNESLAYSLIAGDQDFEDYLKKKYSHEEMAEPRSINEILTNLQMVKRK